MKKLCFRFVQMLCFLFFIAMLAQYSLVSNYAKNGISVWASNVLPLLLPFIILSKFWIRYRIPELFFRQAQKIFSDSTGIAISLPVFLLGLCSGFPIGAIFISYYYQNKTLSKKQAECLLPLASFLNPMFIMGYLRSQINLQGRAWLCYFLSLYLPVFLCYVGIQCFDRYQNNHRKKQTIQTLAKNSLSPIKRSCSKKASLSDDVWLPSIEIISIIGIYIMIFSILSGMLMRLSLFRTPICTCLLANLEITTGIHLLAVSDIYSLKAMYALSAMAASFGGLCTMAQVQTVIADTDLSLKKYAAIKIVTALSSGLLCSILV